MGKIKKPPKQLIMGLAREERGRLLFPRYLPQTMAAMNRRKPPAMRNFTIPHAVPNNLVIR